MSLTLSGSRSISRRLVLCLRCTDCSAVFCCRDGLVSAATTVASRHALGRALWSERPRSEAAVGERVIKTLYTMGSVGLGQIT